MICSTLTKRVLTALFLIPLAYFFIFKGGIFYSIFLITIMIISLYEVVKIIFWQNYSVRAKEKCLYCFFAILYIAFSMYSLYTIRGSVQGYELTLYLFFTVCVFDTSAYFIGSLLKGPKLMPKISPKKTWSGLIGGSLITLVTIFSTFHALDQDLETAFITAFISCIIGVMGQIGDFIESSFKRKFGVKDSGSLLPGHGGILDRMDSVFLSSITLFLFRFHKY